jgi:hypothetical protein
LHTVGVSIERRNSNWLCDGIAVMSVPFGSGYCRPAGRA